jgi:site-specific DNA recombinase
MKKKQRVVIYIRYSSHKQAESFSIEYQVAECTRFIEMNDYELVDTYIDEAKTGQKIAGRDAFDKMMFEAGQDKFDKIIVFSFSRSFRNTRDALNCNHDLQEKYGIMIESVIERIDLSDPHGKFSGTNLFAMHELQAAIIAAHVRSGMYYAAQQGYYLGGFVPFGYELYETGELSRGKERKKYSPNPEEAELVREMFDLYADGFSLNFIQTAMKLKNVRGRRGDIIGQQTIARILKNPMYIGTVEAKFKGHDPLSIPNAVPAIIDMDTWGRVQARHKGNKLVQPRRTKRLYSLTGKITCAKCGGHMFGTYKGDKRSNNWHYAYYHCANKKIKGTCNALNVRKDQIDAYCLQEIKKHILNEEAMRSISEQIATAVGNSADDMAKAKAKAEKRMEQIVDILAKIKEDYYEGKITEAVERRMAAKYEAEQLELESSLRGLKTALKSAITSETVYSYLQELLSLYGSNNDELQKMLFDKLIDKILVHDDRIEVTLVVSPFGHIGDNSPSGQPKYEQSLMVGRKEIRHI